MRVIIGDISLLIHKYNVINYGACYGGILNSLPAFRFYISRWYDTHAVSLIMLTASTIAFLTVAMAFVTLYQQEVQFRVTRNGIPSLRKAQPVRPIPTYTAIDLPAFSTAAAVKSFNSIAEDMHVPLDEVIYMLDSPANLPYQRYRITLNAKAAYPEIRKFVAVLASEMPNVALDSIRCARPDAVAPVLGCELTFSAFFEKPEHG